MYKDRHSESRHKWNLALHQALVRDVASLITRDTPSLQEVGDLLKGTGVWLRVFKSPFSSPGEWTDMHPPLILEMLEAAGKLGEVRSVQHALTDLTDAEQWRQYTFEELKFRYDFYTQHRDRSLSRYYVPYSRPLK